MLLLLDAAGAEALSFDEEAPSDFELLSDELGDLLESKEELLSPDLESEPLASEPLESGLFESELEPEPESEDFFWPLLA